jgi:hypothetical protein
MQKVISLLTIISVSILLFQIDAGAEDHLFEQYLYDVDCAKKAIADDGTVLRTFPEKHTVACLQKPSCRASGYGLIIRNTKTGRYNFYKFDKKGDELAIKLLEKTKKTDNMKIKVKGTIDTKKMILKVKSIEEK